MCRYAVHSYKPHFACFGCRKMFRQAALSNRVRPLRADENGIRIALCPQCGVRMNNLGLDFKAPKQSDVEQWKKVEKLFAAGVAFGSCGCSGPGPRPQRLKEVEQFLLGRQNAAHERKRLAWISEQAAELKTKRRQRAKMRAQHRAKKAGVAI